MTHTFKIVCLCFLNIVTVGEALNICQTVLVLALSFRLLDQACHTIKSHLKTHMRFIGLKSNILEVATRNYDRQRNPIDPPPC